MPENQFYQAKIFLKRKLEELKLFLLTNNPLGSFYMKKNKIYYMLLSLLITFNFAQKAELITQQVNVENAIRGKVENTINKFLEKQYLSLMAYF